MLIFGCFLRERNSWIKMKVKASRGSGEAGTNRERNGVLITLIKSQEAGLCHKQNGNKKLINRNENSSEKKQR